MVSDLRPVKREKLEGTAPAPALKAPLRFSLCSADRRQHSSLALAVHRAQRP
jgi:hypothetical protein